MLRIESVEIKNIKGIASATFGLGTLTVIRGANGTGKTSILDSIATIFDGGHDPELLRKGAVRGHVQITLSNGTTIKKSVTEKASTLDITTGDGLKVTKPATFVQQLATGFAYDPIAFLEADSKKRAQFLLEAMPIEFLPKEIEAITGTAPARPVDIDGFAQIRQAVYDKRRDANVVQRDIGATLTTLRESLPPGDEQDWPAIVQGWRTAQADLRARLNALQVAIKTEADAQRAEAKAAYETELRKIEAKAATALSEQTAETQAELQTVASELATAEAALDAQRRAANLRTQIADYSKRLDGKLMESMRLDEQLKALDELKTAKLSEAAIPGVEVVNGKILVDGIPLDQLNTQRQYELAFQICTLKCGELGFLICDRIESLVGVNWEDFKAAAAESGFQIILARAEAGEGLCLEADGEVVQIGAQVGEKGGRK